MRKATLPCQCLETTRIFRRIQTRTQSGSSIQAHNRFASLASLWWTQPLQALDEFLQCRGKPSGASRRASQKAAVTLAEAACVDLLLSHTLNMR